MTFPSDAKCFSSSLFVIRGDNPVTYKLFPGFSTDGLLDLDLETDLERDLLYRFGEGE